MHGFLVRGLVAAGVLAWVAHAFAPAMQLLFCFAGGALIAALLTARLVDQLAAPLTRPVAWVRHLTRHPA